jgi:hypothetical protein
MNPQYLALFNKYINGDEKAISLLDTALDVSLDTAYLRGSHDERIEWLDYHDERMVLDEANDSIYDLMVELNIEAPIVSYLSLLEAESEQA